MTTKNQSNKTQSIEAIKLETAQIKQSFLAEHEAITAAHSATIPLIEKYEIEPNQSNRTAALQAIETKNKYELLLDIFPEDSIEYFQKIAVQKYYLDNSAMIADALDYKFKGIVANYPTVKETLLSRIADMGNKALSLVGVERAAAFSSRDQLEDAFLFFEAQSQDYKNAVLYFRGNPSSESFANCEGVIGILEHEMSKNYF